MPIDIGHSGLGLFPGSQDAEAVDYMRLPTEMATFSQPLVPEPEDVDDCPRVLERLRQVLAALQAYPRQGAASIAVNDLDERERRLLDQFLGEGEVSIIRAGADGEQQIQESVLAGLWRLRQLDGQGQCSDDQLLVTAIPEQVKQPAVALIGDTELDDATLMNARAVYNEVVDRQQKYRPGAPAQIINLSLLPMNDADLRWLSAQLGSGGVEILSRGYGNCRISLSHLPNVWWVRYFNSMDTPIQTGIEITEVPEVACAAAEDIADSARRLAALLEDFQ